MSVRLRFLFSAALLISCSAPIKSESPGIERRLRLYHTHTGERIDVAFRTGDTYVASARDQLNHFLRDSRTGEAHHYDPRVFDLLADVLDALAAPNAELHIICGYRTPDTNEFLRTHTSGVARNSLHMQAEAIDIRLPGVSTQKLRDTALKLGRGGVGYYPQSGFIHVDVGRVRRW